MRSSVRLRIPFITALSLLMLTSTALFPGFLAPDALAATNAETATLEHPLVTGTTTSHFADNLAALTQTLPTPQHKVVHVITSYIPTHLDIPSAGIHAPVVGVGVNAKGEMDVPDGSSMNVGWYDRGVKPGQPGTAVFDAHVFAAFRHLDGAHVGDDIYVTTEDGSKLHFKVTNTVFYRLSTLSPATLFARTNERDINLITCAGTFDPSIGTYDHRLIVTAELVD